MSAATMEKPKQKAEARPVIEPAPAPVVSGSPTRAPRVGTSVIYWAKENLGLVAQHAVVAALPNTGGCHLNVFPFGYMTAAWNVQHSETPKMGHWTWPEA